jgi:hypothetical protein
VAFFLGLGVCPVLLALTGLWLGLDDGSLAWDFHHELYPQAEEMLAGRNPYPSEGFNAAEGNNFVFPPVAAFVVSPLTLLPPTAADVAMALLGIACFVASLWIVGVRDWRVYGALGLWPPVYIESGLGHLTPMIALLAAAAWRLQASRHAVGVLVGFAVALKLFAWPLFVWLAAAGRWRAAAAGTLVAGASLLLVLPYTGMDDYVRALSEVNATFDQDTYTVFGLLVQSGASEIVARVVAILGAIVLLWGTWRYRSFSLAVAGVLVASPIVWLDYFALAAIPLAIARPRFSPVWLVPLATVGLEGAGLAIGDALGTARVLGAFAVVLGVAFRAERALTHEGVRSSVAAGAVRPAG